MGAMLGSGLRLVVKVLGSLVADEVGQVTRERRRSRQDPNSSAEGKACPPGTGPTPWTGTPLRRRCGTPWRASARSM